MLTSVKWKSRCTPSPTGIGDFLHSKQAIYHGTRDHRKLSYANSNHWSIGLLPTLTGRFLYSLAQWQGIYFACSVPCSILASSCEAGKRPFLKSCRSTASQCRKYWTRWTNGLVHPLRSTYGERQAWFNKRNKTPLMYFKGQLKNKCYAKGQVGGCFYWKGRAKDRCHEQHLASTFCPLHPLGVLTHKRPFWRLAAVLQWLLLMLNQNAAPSHIGALSFLKMLHPQQGWPIVQCTWTRVWRDKASEP